MAIFNPPPYIANPNQIINGNFDFWQRGTAAFTVDGFTADRWNGSRSGSSLSTTRQTTSLSDTFKSRYYIQNVVTSSVGAGNYAGVEHKIEDVRILAGKTVTLSFYAKAASGTPSISVEFGQNFGSGGSPSSAVTAISVYKPTLSTSWGKYTTTVTLPSVSGKTIGSNENSSTYMFFWFDAGSTFNSRTSSLGQQSGTFSIAQIKLEEGPVATPFTLAGGNLAGEFEACQRYFIKSVGSIDGTGDSRFFAPGYGNSTTVVSASVYLPTPMRAAPTITLGAAANWRVYPSASISSVGTSQVTPMKFTIDLTGTGVTASGVYSSAWVSGTSDAWQAEAELF